MNRAPLSGTRNEGRATNAHTWKTGTTRGFAMRTRKQKAFSLIELVIVIVILAVISAIAVPRISRGAKGADESALGQNLAVLRSAIELYSAEHGGVFPGANADGGTGAAGSPEAFTTQLTMYSDKSGNVSATKDATFKFGPYLHKIPPLPVGAQTGNRNMSVGNTGPVANTVGDFGWIYNYETGAIIGNADDMDESGTRTYDQW
jgi:prepilin-type N-terminal cleavage/methylation domain-containing protein